jgi:F-type H+-transporting ATPase subunit b
MSRSWLLVVGLALGTLVCPCRPVRAEGAAPVAGKAEQKAAPDKGHGAAGREEEQPIPFGNWALDLTVWTIVVFLVLLWVLSKYAWKPIAEGLDRREHSIHAAVQDAQRARDEAAALRQELQEKINKAHQDVAAMLDEARKGAQASTDRLMAEERVKIQAERDRMQHEIELARDQALQQIWNQTAQLAALVSSRAIRRQLTPDDHRQLVEEALADLRRAAEQRQHMVASLQ